MTGPRWVGVRRGRHSLVLDRTTGVRHLYTAEPRRSGMGWKDRALVTGCLTLGLACCVLFPEAVALAYAALGAVVLAVLLVHGAKSALVKLGIWMRVR